MKLSTGERILVLRRRHHLTQTQLIYRLSQQGTTLNRTALVEIEKSTAQSATSKWTILAAMADVLGTTTDYLLERTEDPSPLPSDQEPSYGS